MKNDMKVTYGTYKAGLCPFYFAMHKIPMEPVYFVESNSTLRKAYKNEFPSVPIYRTKKDAEKALFKQWLKGWEERKGESCTSKLIIGRNNGSANKFSGRRKEEDRRLRPLQDFTNFVKTTCAPWIIWEDMPAILAIDSGMAFRRVFGYLQYCGYSIGWRVLDPLYLGSPSTGPKLYLVGYKRQWQLPFNVLFDESDLLGNTHVLPKAQAELRQPEADPECTEDSQAVRSLGRDDLTQLSKYLIEEEAGALPWLIRRLFKIIQQS